jgi:DHA1 family multidrug resistance protein-like MFS transporter
VIGCAVLLGVGMALVYTAIGALLADGVPAPRRGLAMGMYNSCIYLGMMAGSAAMGMVLRRIGFPAGFAVAGAVALASVPLFLALVRQGER